MSSVIKAADRNQGLHAQAFNFDDLTSRAERLLDQVREQARQILAQAMQEAQAIRQAADQEGRKDAARSIEKQAEERVSQQVKTLLPALREAIEQLVQSRHTWQTQWERQAVHLCASIARRVIRRELSVDPQINLDLIREALSLGASSGNLRVLLHPSDYQALEPHLEGLRAEFAQLGQVEFARESKLTRGGCRVETRFGSIDQQIEVQLERIERELT